MSEEYSFVPNAVTLSNISRLSNETSVIGELRICELSDVAESLARATLELESSGLGICEVLSLAADSLTIDCGKIHSDALSENRGRLNNYLLALSHLDKCVICELYLEALAKNGRKISESDFLFGASCEQTFVYVKNPYADEAYDVFSQEFSDPRVRYAANIKEAVRLVEEQVVSYCLLPIEERGSRLLTVEEIIFREDLKINALTPVFGFDGNANMKYALVSKSFSLTQHEPDDDRYFEIRVEKDDNSDLSQILLVAEGYGLGLYRISTVSYDTADGMRTYYSAVFSNKGKDFSKLLVYLTLFRNEYTPVGLYKNQE